jgi:hypothetical protein
LPRDYLKRINILSEERYQSLEITVKKKDQSILPKKNPNMLIIMRKLKKKLIYLFMSL